VYRPSAKPAGGRYDPHEDPTTMKQNFNRATYAAACALLLAACSAGNVLTVKDLNSPDVARAYSTPAGVESIIGTLYQQLNGGVNTVNVQAQGHVMSLEGYSTVANFGMNVRASIPRNAIVNDRGNNVDAGNLADFSNNQKLARNAANLVQAMDLITKGGGTTGNSATDARDRGFAQFVNACALGYVALVYDSAAIVNNQVSSNVIPPLSGYAAVMAAALAEMDSALATAGGATAASAFPLPPAWISGNGMTQAQFVQFVHSWKARLRAGVARSPAERAAVSWASVIADANAGITADISLLMGGGWNCDYDCSQMYVSNGWHEMSPLILGMADTSGAYEAFLAQPFASRDGSLVLIRTPDQRLPQGATRGAQQLDTPYNGNSFVPGRYFANRQAADDFPGDGWGTSNYDHKRYLAIYRLSGVGNQVQFALAENTMLAAEGYIYAGQFAQAAALIDASRAKHGLASIGAIASASQQIQGGINGCVPQVPAPPTFGTAACGSILEAMKWEKRMETAYSGYMTWFQDSRGWGDLPAGTAIHWPVPNEEMDSRQEPFYNMGGAGQPGSAAKGTYGF
jgi:hypothetical protein